MKTFYILLLTLVCHLAIAQTPFITRWNLATAGSGDTQLTFGVATSGTVSYTWQEVSPGTRSGAGTFTGSTATITGLPSGAVIDLSISPTNFNRFIINDGTDKNRLTDVRQWGTTAWTSMSFAFMGCSNLQITASDLPNLTGVIYMSYTFNECTILNGPSNIGSWNTVNVTAMNSMFLDASAFNQPIGFWNTANVTDMSNMFQRATAFNQPIGGWNTAKVFDMEAMFSGATAFNQPISTKPNGIWNTGKVTKMVSMFSSAAAFNQPIGNWDTGKVVNMNNMFFNATAFNQPLGNWNTGSVTSMNNMFSGATTFNQPIGTWNTTSVTTMGSMFRGASEFNQSLSNWSTANVTSMSQIFQFATSFNKSLGSWALHASVILSNMFTASGLDCNQYSATLIGWSASTATPSGRSLGASDRSYGTNAVTARNNLVTTKGWTITGDAASGSDCSGALPVSLVSFSGKKIAENQNLLKWITADEKDFDRFEVQRSEDAKVFETIGRVLGQKVNLETNMGEPVNGQTVNGGTPNNGALSTYTFTDLTTGASNYYRLKMVDIDGSFDYSRIISIENSSEQAVVGSFYPNPSNGNVFVDVYAVESGSWTLTITDVGGRIIGTQVHDLQKGMNKIDLNHLSPGLNLVRFEHGAFSDVRKLIRE